ncbi:MAG: nucleotidyl transferase AbiEii/AbiGii toxin family protein [Planctomycetes bacterium]|nr:nucleotidyl transferase AbiEii/AbiGii toxin family protein [Planctomycetota bacterium]
MAWHPEILAQRQQRVLAQIGPALAQRGFYLAGGTAVALHLGHRRSVDLDWFAPELTDPERLAIDLREQAIPFATEDVAPGTLHGAVCGVRVSLLRYRYRMLSGLRTLPGGIPIAGRADLAAMKLLAVAQRGAKKDFVDIYALGRRAKSLRQMLRWYKGKFAVEDVAHLLRSLAYFDDADRERLPRMLWDVRWRDIKETIQRWVRRVAQYA